MAAAVDAGADGRHAPEAHRRARRRTDDARAASSINRCAIACPTRACRSRTSSRSPDTKVTSPSASTRTASRANSSSQMSKEGSTIGGLMDTVGTLTSMALQYGVPLEEPGEEIRLPTLRAERVHQESRYPQRHQHHRLRLSLARLPVHQRLQGSDLAEPGPARAADERESPRWRKKPSIDRSPTCARTGEKELIDVITPSAKPGNVGRLPLETGNGRTPRRARHRKRSATCSWTSPAPTAAATR